MLFHIPALPVTLSHGDQAVNLRDDSLTLLPIALYNFSICLNVEKQIVGSLFV